VREYPDWLIRALGLVVPFDQARYPERILFPGCVAVLLAAALAGCAGGTDAVDQRGGSDLGFVPGNAATGVLAVDRRQAAPEVRGQLLGGTAYDLGSLRGTVTVVNFWGGVRLVG